MSEAREQVFDCAMSWADVRETLRKKGLAMQCTAQLDSTCWLKQRRKEDYEQ
jgi:hypothetical protein